MINNSESKADGLNNTETKGIRVVDSGGNPRSIRKRGYHRALKRGEEWAISRHTFNSVLDAISKALYTTKQGTIEGIGSWVKLYNG